MTDEQERAMNATYDADARVGQAVRNAREFTIVALGFLGLAIRAAWYDPAGVLDPIVAEVIGGLAAVSVVVAVQQWAAAFRLNKVDGLTWGVTESVRERMRADAKRLLEEDETQGQPAKDGRATTAGDGSPHAATSRRAA